jgi:hypothetical protein
LNKKFVTAVARATTPKLTLATSAVDVEPTLAPMTIGTAASAGRMPCCTSRIATPVVTLLD